MWLSKILKLLARLYEVKLRQTQAGSYKRGEKLQTSKVKRRLRENVNQSSLSRVGWYDRSLEIISCAMYQFVFWYSVYICCMYKWLTSFVRQSLGATTWLYSHALYHLVENKFCEYDAAPQLLFITFSLANIIYYLLDYLALLSAS